jgi:uncharacterized phage-associated protein
MDIFGNMIHHFIQKERSILDKTVLFKLCYFSDFDFYELNERSITGTIYHKLTHGPVPSDFDAAMRSLETQDLAREERICNDDGTYPRYKYHLLKATDPKKAFSQEEIDMMDRVFDRYGKMTAVTLSDLSHQDIPWKITEDGEEIPYEAVFFRNKVTSVRDDIAAANKPHIG